MFLSAFVICSLSKWRNGSLSLSLSLATWTMRVKQLLSISRGGAHTRYRFSAVIQVISYLYDVRTRLMRRKTFRYSPPVLKGFNRLYNRVRGRHAFHDVQRGSAYEADRKRNYRILIGGHRRFVPNVRSLNVRNQHEGVEIVDRRNTSLRLIGVPTAPCVSSCRNPTTHK